MTLAVPRTSTSFRGRSLAVAAPDFEHLLLSEKNADGTVQLARCDFLCVLLSRNEYVARSLRYRVTKSVGAKGDFGRFLSSEQHADGYV